MTSKQILIQEIESLPPQIIEEVYNFVCFLKVKKAQENENGSILFASEKVLSKDWLLPEEELAWANL